MRQNEWLGALTFLCLVLLTLPLAFALSVADLAPEGFKFIPPEDPSRSAALAALGDARSLVGEMEAHNFSVQFVRDALDEADAAFAHEDYVSVFRLSQLIRFISDISLTFRDAVQVTTQRIDVLERDGADIGSVRALLDKAMHAFTEEQYDEVNVLFAKTNDALKQVEAEHKRTQLIKRLSRNVLLRYWRQILLVIVVLGIVSVPAARKMRKFLLQRRIIHLKDELKHAQELIKIMQKKCFIEKKMTTQTYKANVECYEDKIAEIKHTLPVLEARLRSDSKEVFQ